MFTLWGHVALSSPHQTSLFLVDKAEKDMRLLMDMLKVSYMFTISKMENLLWRYLKLSYVLFLGRYK